LNTSTKNKFNLERFWKYLSENPTVKVVAFNVSSRELRSIVDKDMSEYWKTSALSGLTEIINKFIDLDSEVKERFPNTGPEDWDEWNNADLYICYQLFKMSWLAQDIRKNGVQAPVQFLKTVESYHCHPGSDKKVALTLLDQHDSIPCFYIHYPELDPYPIHEHLEHRVINTEQEFVDLFEMASNETFQIDVSNVDFKMDSDGKSVNWKCIGHFNPFGEYAAGVLRKQRIRHGVNQVPMTVKHLSYHDRIHRLNMINEMEIFHNIGLLTDDIFNLNGTKLYKTTVGDSCIWVPESFRNFPSSLYDEDWKVDEEKSLTWKLTYFNLDDKII